MRVSQSMASSPAPLILPPPPSRRRSPVVEQRLVWHVTATESESFETLTEGIAHHHRAPDALGLYTRTSEGLLEWRSDHPFAPAGRAV